MIRQLVGTALLLAFSFTFADAEQRGKGGGKSKGGEPNRSGGQHAGGGNSGGRGGGKAPGGAWSPGKSPAGNGGHHAQGEGQHSGVGASSKGDAAKHNPSNASGKEGAAAAAKRNQPSATGKEGAAAGAAASKRNNPTATGKEGAAAGAAAANRNNPTATGKQGAAAGAAAANRNNPTATGAEGAAVGAAAANRNQPNVSGAAGAAYGYAGVRNSFDHPNVYNADWYAAHQGAWSPANASAASVWTAASLDTVATHCSYGSTAPVNYNYGDNVIYQDGNVSVDGQSVGTGEEFSQQAADLAHAGHDAETADSDDWLPLGVFALVRSEDQHPQLTLQMSVNQQGILRGNYTDVVSDSTQPIIGSVDKETQRAAWTIGENQNVFMEAGLKNLTDGEAPTLMHKYGKTEKWMLVRLEQPATEGDAATEPKESTNN